MAPTPSSSPAAARPARSSPVPAPPTQARLPATGSVGGSVFTGLGFDTCSAPSTKAMAAWAESPFRGVGIYIGGENSACSQPNLSASWVSAQTTAGWHLIPTYVGLQATTSSCGSCAKMTTAAAATQGMAAAEDAVTEAGAIGIGTGSPIYFDMEAYSPTASATKAMLTFLEAWTEKLHALGYQSGVYSSERLRHRRPRRPYRDDLRPPRRPLDRQLEQPRRHRRPGRPDHRLGEPPAHPPVPRRPRRHLRRHHDQHRQRLRRRGDGRGRHAAGRRIGPDRLARAHRLARRPASCGSKGWALDPDAPTEALSINVYRRRPRRPERRRNSSNSARSPTSNGPTSPPPTSSRAPYHGFDTHDHHDQVGAGADLRLRAERGARRQPPARLQDDEHPGRGHLHAAEGDAARGQGDARLPVARPAPPAPATSASAPPSKSRRRAATNRRGSTP